MMKNQRGAIFTLFALLIPLIMAFTGLVVDFGNLYAHYSRLQNAADAAAMAGGYAFIQNDEKCEDHPEADKAAHEYKNKNHPHADELEWKIQARPGDDEGTIYYRIILTERVPLYFLRYFPTIGEDTEISAVGCAKVKPNDSSGGGGSGGGGNNMFEHLFTAGKEFTSTNNIGSRSYTDPQQKNGCSTYDGSIVIGDKNGYDKAKKDVYLSSKAFGENGESITTVNKAIANGDVVSPQYDSSINQAAIEKYYHDEIENIMKATEVVDSRDELQKMIDGTKEAKNKIKVTDNNINELKSDDLNKLSNNHVDVIYYTVNNLSIEINQAISGDKNKPLYIICDNINNLNTSANMTDGRPIVLVYTGTYQVTMNCNGGTFTGNIYSPFGSVFVNDNRHMFYGSIVAAKNIQLQSQGYYAQKNYTRPYSGSPGDAPGDPTVILVDDKEIEWT